MNAAGIRFVVGLLGLVVLVGCPESADGPQDGSQNAMMNNTANNTAGTNGPSNGTTSNNDSMPTNVSVDVVPLEWGLFAGPPAGGGLADAGGSPGSRQRATLEVGPGAFALRIQSDSSTVIDVTGTSADRLVPLSGDIATQPFFVPVRTEVTFEVWESDGSWQVQALAPADGPTLPIDSAEPLTEAGGWFDEAFAAIGAAEDPAAATVVLTDIIRAHGGPLVTEQGVLFIAPARDGEPAPQVRGSWNAFGADPLSEMHRITSGFWARFIQLPAGRQEYKIYYSSGAAWVTDRANRHINWDGIDPNTVGAFNSVIAPTGARTVWLPDVHSDGLGNDRDIYVHLPASYDANTSKSYPVLYVQDGNESIVRSQFHTVADETAVADPATEAILAFIALPSQDVRLEEYTMGTAGALGDAYVDFLAGPVVGLVDASFRTRTERRARGVMGASLGGLISFWSAMQHPEVFGYTAGMSSSFFWGEDFILGEIQSRGCQDVVYYLDSGSPDDNFEITQTMRDTLDSMGCEYDYVLEPGGQHDWAFWRGRFGGVLRDFADAHGG